MNFNQLLLNFIILAVIVITADAATTSMRGSISIKNNDIDEEGRMVNSHNFSTDEPYISPSSVPAFECIDNEGQFKIKNKKNKNNCNTWAKKGFCENKFKNGNMELVKDVRYNF
jgi:hypothetical protein